MCHNATHKVCYIFRLYLLLLKLYGPGKQNDKQSNKINQKWIKNKAISLLIKEHCYSIPNLGTKVTTLVAYAFA